MIGFITRKLIVASMFLISCNIFAATVCPSVSDIKTNTKFIEAGKIDIFNREVWSLSSSIFNYQGKEWNVGLAIDATLLGNPKNAEQAMQAAQAYFGSILTEPQQTEEAGHVICIYASQDNNYSLVASNPPFTDSDGFNKRYLS